MKFCRSPYFIYFASRRIRTVLNFSTMSDYSSRNVKINTYVFFDTETTGLPGQSWGRTRITELSLCAARVQDLQTNSIGLPRVINKLSLCLSPQKLIDGKASEITGLTNELLEHYGSFDDSVFSLLENFLIRLPQPVCLLAHNGNRFDFPILQSELSHIQKRLPEDLLCADTFNCFRQLFGGNNNVRKKLFTSPSKRKEPVMSMDIDGIQPLGATPVTFATSTSSTVVSTPGQTITTNVTMSAFSLTSPGDPLCDEWDMELVKLLDQMDQETLAKQQATNVEPPTTAQNIHVNEQTPSARSNVQQINETTPQRPIVVEQNLKLNVKPKSFRLADVYAHVTESPVPPNLHSAEADTLALMECAARLFPHFNDWVETNAVLFNVAFKNDTKTSENNK